MYKEKLLIICLFILSFALRAISLSTIPESLSRDEVSLGYNAALIASTGKDEYQERLPFLFRSLNDYKLPVPVYLSAILDKVFGPNEIFIRLPTAILGSLTTIILYLILRNFISKKPAFLSAFSLGICPWHVQMSRIMSESVIALGFLSIAVYFFLLIRKKYSPFCFLTSIVFFILSFLSYRTELIFIPIVFVVLTILVRHNIAQLNPKNILFFVSTSLFLFFSLFVSAVKIGKTRFAEVSIFSSREIFLTLAEKIREENTTQVIITRIFHNKLIPFVETIGQNYFSHFDVNYLFIRGDINFPENSIPSLGQYHFIELLFLVIGIFYLFRLKYSNKFKFFIISWLLIGPIASSLTQGTPNSFRNLVSVLGISAIIGFGLSKIHMKKVLIALMFIYTFSFSFAIHQYIVHRKIHQPWTRDLQIRELFTYINQNEGRFDHVYFENYPDLYIFFLFYRNISPTALSKLPREYLKADNRAKLISLIDPKMIITEKDSCPQKHLQGKELYVCRGKINSGEQTLKTFYYPNGDTAFTLFRN